MQVWILVISHRYGDDITAYGTQELAWATLVDYVRDWWDHETKGRDFDEGEDPSCPEDDTEAVEQYFNLVDDEFYSIQELTVQDPREETVHA
jgi:hypothetical protein